MKMQLKDGNRTSECVVHEERMLGTYRYVFLINNDEFWRDGGFADEKSAMKKCITQNMMIELE